MTRYASYSIAAHSFPDISGCYSSVISPRHFCRKMREENIIFFSSWRRGKQQHLLLRQWEKCIVVVDIGRSSAQEAHRHRHICGWWNGSGKEKKKRRKENRRNLLLSQTGIRARADNKFLNSLVLPRDICSASTNITERRRKTTTTTTYCTQKTSDAQGSSIVVFGIKRNDVIPHRVFLFGLERISKSHLFLLLSSFAYICHFRVFFPLRLRIVYLDRQISQCLSSVLTAQRKWCTVVMRWGLGACRCRHWMQQQEYRTSS